MNSREKCPNPKNRMYIGLDAQNTGGVMGLLNKRYSWIAEITRHSEAEP